MMRPEEKKLLENTFGRRTARPNFGKPARVAGHPACRPAATQSSVG